MRPAPVLLERSATRRLEDTYARRAGVVSSDFAAAYVLVHSVLTAPNGSCKAIVLINVDMDRGCLVMLCYIVT